MFRNLDLRITAAKAIAAQGFLHFPFAPSNPHLNRITPCYAVTNPRCWITQHPAEHLEKLANI